MGRACVCHLLCKLLLCMRRQYPTIHPAHACISCCAGLLTLLNATHAKWELRRNQDPPGVAADSIVITKNTTCQGI